MLRFTEAMALLPLCCASLEQSCQSAKDHMDHVGLLQDHVGVLQHSGHTGPRLSTLQATISAEAAASAAETNACDVPSAEKLIFVNSEYPTLIRALDGMLLPDCAASCRIRTDAAALHEADAVVWNARWMSPVGRAPAVKRECQKWVFSFYEESAIYEGHTVNERTSAAFGDRVDWTMTYRPDSDFYQPMYRLSPHEGDAGASLVAGQSPAANKPELMLWLASNCSPRRQRYFERLKSFLPTERVHTFGRCGMEMSCPRRPVECEEAPDDCMMMEAPSACEENFFGRYKFYAALENSRCTGYITEKFARAYRFGMVPVVVGGRSRADYEAIAPADSFIHIDDFPSTQALAAHLMHLDQDDEAYNRMFAWRSQVSLLPTMQNDVQPFCELCQELHKPHAQQKASFGNVVDWWYDNTCEAEAYPSHLFA